MGLSARLLLKPVFKLMWRKGTFPVAKWLYLVALRKKIDKACRGADVVHYFGVGCEMLGFAAAASAKRQGATVNIRAARYFKSPTADGFVPASRR